MPQGSFEQQFAELQKQYIEKLPKHYSEIRSAWEHLQYVNWDHKKLASLTQACHRLAGSGASYGFTAITSSARALENTLSAIHSQASPADRKKISQLMSELGQAIDAAHPPRQGASRKQADADDNLAAPPLLSERAEQPRHNIAVIEDDPAQAQLLKISLQALGYEVNSFSSPDAFAKVQGDTPYDLIILDLSFPEGPLEGLFWLEHIHKQLNTHCPIIITSARSDFVARMRALRAGASAYMTKPVDMAQLSNHLSDCLNPSKEQATRVLWVDDDEQLLALYQELLNQQGFQFAGVSQPFKILEKLESFLPDIMIMDYQMPGCTGAELASMLKQDARFMSIPIIFASGSISAREHTEELNLLGNAFIQKPVDSTELLTSIKTQLNKARLLTRKISQVSQRLDTNSLQTKHFFLENLESLLFQNNFDEHTQNTFLVYATIDNLDYLKERFGIRNLSKLARQLEQYLAKHDLIQGQGCAISDTSYLLLITLSHHDSAKDSLANLFKTLSNTSWSIDNKSCKISLTMSTLQLQNNAKLDDIIARLEQACLEGLKSGGSKFNWVKGAEQHQKQLDDTLKALLKAKSFKLLFQPIVNLEKDELLFETMIRLQDSKGNTYSAEQFLPWVDDTLEGGIASLDRWLIEQAQAHVRKSSEHATPCLIIKLASPLKRIVNLLPEIRFSRLQQQEKKQLIFSLPISVVMQDIEKARDIIESLAELGCGFMLEGLEAKKSHLTLLKDIGNIDYLQIRASQKTSQALDQFIKQVQQDPKGLTLIVSGIEDSAMLAHYWDSGIRHFQGYFIQQASEDMVLEEQT